MKTYPPFLPHTIKAGSNCQADKIRIEEAVKKSLFICAWPFEAQRVGY
jgi:hypothetical protein